MDSSRVVVSFRARSDADSCTKFSGPTRFLNALYGGHRPPEFVGALTEREVDEDVVAVDALVHSSASRRRRAGDGDGDGDGEEVRARERRLKRNEALRVYRRKKALAMREAKTRSDEAKMARSDEAKKTRSDEPTNASDSEPAPTASGSDDTPDDDYLIETPDSGTS